MTSKKITVRCTNITMTEQFSTVAFSTDLKPAAKTPAAVLNAGNSVFAIQFDNAKDAKEFDMNGTYEITIADKK